MSREYREAHRLPCPIFRRCPRRHPPPRRSDKMLAQAVQAEVDAFLAERDHLVDENGRRQVVRNGHLPEAQRSRRLVGGTRCPAAASPRSSAAGRSSERRSPRRSCRPTCARPSRSRSLIPWLYLKGVSTGGFCRSPAGPPRPQRQGPLGLHRHPPQERLGDRSTRLGRAARSERQAVRVRLGRRHPLQRPSGSTENRKQCILVLMGATAQGTKELLAIQTATARARPPGRAAASSFDSDGLEDPPNAGDRRRRARLLGGALASCSRRPESSAAGCTRPPTSSTSCRSRAAARQGGLHEIWQAETAGGRNGLRQFLEKYEAKYPKAARCSGEGSRALLAFYDFPAEHWRHLRTRIRSSRPSPRSGSEPRRPKAAVAGSPRSRWSSGWPSQLKRDGER